MYVNNSSPPVPDAERHRLLIEWNKTQSKYPHDECVHQRFEAQVEQSPQNIAVIFEDQRLTYLDLNCRANQLARYLQNMGVGPEVSVGICVERSPEMVVGLLAVLKAGGAYIPLDPVFPKDRLALMVQDSELSILLTQQQLVGQLPHHNAHVIPLDTEWKTIAENDILNLTSAANVDNLAYIIYTSGSTGKPKGIQITHQALSNFLYSMRRQPGMNSQDVLLAVTTLSFDIAALELLLPLAVGARLVIASRDVTIDGSQLLKSLITSKATLMQATPATWRLLLASGWDDDLSQLKILCGGEALSRNLANRLLDKSTNVWNMFGPTETTIWSTIHPVKPKEGPISIGRPIANTTVYILDSNLNPVPVGTPGVLYIGGDGLARGYINRSGLTAEKFIPNPFNETPGDRLYNTGDLARYLPNGNIEFLGRIDHQVKIRGFRIELGEVESALVQHPAIREAVVVGRQDNDDETYLAAYFVSASDEQAPKIGEMRSFLRNNLPDYMLPSAFIRLDSLPLTPNGKVDRKALPSPDHSRAQLEMAYVAPETPLEQLLVDMWQEALGIEPIGTSDDFFELGGDSIKGAIITNKIQVQLQEVVHVVALFDAPTVTKLAAYFKQHYPEAVAKLLGLEPSNHLIDQSQEKITVDKVKQLRQIIPELANNDQLITDTPKNPSAIFILSPPRSGSTLLRVILGGHSQLFAPPELELLPFNSLRERKQTLSGRNSHFLEGTLRAIMQIRGIDVAEAQRTMLELEERDLSIKQFYGSLQEWLNEKTLVDKSTTYAFDLETLRRIEQYFDNPLYIHLVRHPYGMIRSFEKARLDQIFFRYEHPFSSRELGELLWLISHQNIIKLLAGVPSHRQFNIKFEDLVRHPQTNVQDLCQFLNVKFQPNMLLPYQDKKQRMTDGLYDVSRMIGDFKFHEHQAIASNVADRWKQDYSDDFLGDLTLEMAKTWDYDPIKTETNSNSVSQIRRLGQNDDLDLLTQLDQLSDEQVDSLLNGLLAEKEEHNL